MNLYEEIRNNAGIDDVEYLSEGIVFFKNSKKIGRLAKLINRKREKLMKKGDMASAQALKPLYDKSIKVADSFEKLENEFKVSKGNDKTKIKAKYNEAEQEFKNLLKVAKKDSTKKALISAGGAAIVIGILIAAVFGLQTLKDSGALSGVNDNVEARIANLKNSRVPDNAIFNTGNNKADVGLGKLAKNVAGFANDQTIKNTNKDLMKLVLGVGAVSGGLLGNGLLKKIRNAGRTNKTIADTAIALEDLNKLKETKEEK